MIYKYKKALYALLALILSNVLFATVVVQETTTTTYQKPAVVYVKQYTASELREMEQNKHYNNWQRSLPSKDRDFIYLYDMHVSSVRPSIFRSKMAIARHHWRNKEDQDRWMEELWHREYIFRLQVAGILLSICATIALTITIIRKYDLFVPLCCFANAYNNVYGNGAVIPVTTTTTTICTF